MDRKIKFRVFDTLVGEMIGDNMHVIGESFCCGRIENWIRNHSYKKPFLERYNDMIIMQYTGFEDRNGQDIYEGDITIGKYHSETKAIIIWNLGGFEAQGINNKVPPSLIDFTKAGEVIGNKFENPELLDRDNDDES